MRRAAYRRRVVVMEGEAMNVRGWLSRFSKGFFALAVISGVAIVVLSILSSTVYGARPGCEECSPHIALVIYAILAVLVSMLSILVAIVLAVASRMVRT